MLTNISAPKDSQFLPIDKILVHKLCFLDFKVLPQKQYL